MDLSLLDTLALAKVVCCENPPCANDNPWLSPCMDLNRKQCLEWVLQPKGHSWF